MTVFLSPGHCNWPSLRTSMDEDCNQVFIDEHFKISLCHLQELNIKNITVNLFSSFPNQSFFCFYFLPGFSSPSVDQLPGSLTCTKSQIAISTGPRCSIVDAVDGLTADSLATHATTWATTCNNVSSALAVMVGLQTNQGKITKVQCCEIGKSNERMRMKVFYQFLSPH